MNFAQLDFRQLRIKHILYKSKVRSMVYGGTFDREFFSGSGPVIDWVNNVIIPKYGSSPQINELLQLQANLNQLAVELYEMYGNGKIEEARGGLKAVEQTSERFVTLVDGLENKFS